MAHRNENDFHCKMCVKSFTTDYYLKLHDKECHTKSLKCGQCDRLFGSIKRRNMHVKRIHASKNLKCPKCDFCASTKGDLNTHIRRLHDTSKSVNQ